MVAAASQEIIPIGSRLVSSLLGPYGKALENRVNSFPLPKLDLKPVRPVEEPRLFLPIHSPLRQGVDLPPPNVTNVNNPDYFISGHPLEAFIRRTSNEHFTVEELDTILKRINFKLALYPSGTMPASTNDKSSYSEFAWTRDMANKTLAMIEVGCIDEAKTVLYNMARFYNHQDQRSQITNFHWHGGNQDEPHDNYWHGKGGHPPIKAETDTFVS